MRYIQITKRVFPVQDKARSFDELQVQTFPLIYPLAAPILFLHAFNMLPVTAAAKKNDIGVMWQRV